MLNRYTIFLDPPLPATVVYPLRTHREQPNSIKGCLLNLFTKHKNLKSQIWMLMRVLHVCTATKHSTQLHVLNSCTHDTSLQREDATFLEYLCYSLHFSWPTVRQMSRHVTLWQTENWILLFAAIEIIPVPIRTNADNIVTLIEKQTNNRNLVKQTCDISRGIFS